MKILALLLIALISIPAVLAVSKSYQALYPTKKNLTATAPSIPKSFKGLQGVIGVSVEEPERPYGPQKPFGKPKPKRFKGAGNIPPGYVGLGGIAGEAPSISANPCVDLGCQPRHGIIADRSAKTYYRCRCPAARNIPNESIQCLDTPALAERAGYHAGTC